jgi:hypothetical protein
MVVHPYRENGNDTTDDKGPVKKLQTEFCRYRIMENKRKSNDVADADKQYH